MHPVPPSPLPGCCVGFSLPTTRFTLLSWEFALRPIIPCFCLLLLHFWSIVLEERIFKKTKKKVRTVEIKYYWWHLSTRLRLDIDKSITIIEKILSLSGNNEIFQFREIQTLEGFPRTHGGAVKSAILSERIHTYAETLAAWRQTPWLADAVAYVRSARRELRLMGDKNISPLPSTRDTNDSGHENSNEVNWQLWMKSVDSPRWTRAFANVMPTNISCCRSASTT